MKILLMACSLVLFALTAPAAGAPAIGDQAGTTIAYTMSDRGAHYRVWEQAVSVTNSAGQVMTRTNGFTELETGMNYFENGQWQESSTAIESYSTGAIARHGGHKVIFANNLNTVGAIDMQTPDGKRLQSQVIGLSYFDTSSGQSVLIAELKDSQGEIVNGNQVIYPDAFTNISADVRYTYTKAGFEQDIIFRTRPPSPSEWGLNAAATHLQVLTEFLSPPVPMVNENVIQDSVSGGAALVDQTLDFGAMTMGPGRAFDLGEPGGFVQGVPVAKSWSEIEGRKILIEEVEFPKVEDYLNQLPAAQSASKATKSRRIASLKRLLPQPKLARQQKGEMKLAQLDRRQPGFVLDYTTLASSANSVFQGDTTYYVAGQVVLSGLTTIVGGAVIKYTNSSSAGLLFSGPVACKTAQYRPAVFTSKDDNTIGATIAGSSGSPSGFYGTPALFFNGATSVVSLAHIRISNAKYGCFISGYSNHVIADAQFIKCDLPVYASTTTIHVRNALLSGGTAALNGSGSGNSAVSAENVTVSTFGFLSSLTAAAVTNSLFLNVTGWVNNGTFTGAYNSTNTDLGIFQTNGTGYFYLATNTLRNVGTTNINAALLADLKKTTTYPPLNLTSPITADTSLNPQAQRDTDIPDLGYHYDPIDYLTSCTVSNATVTLTNGVVLAYYDSLGLWLQNNGQLLSTGVPQQQDYLVHHQLVQEQQTNLAAINSSQPINFNHGDSNLNPNVYCRFTTFVATQGETNILFSADGGWALNQLGLQDCELFAQGAAITTSGGPTNSVTQLRNNLVRYSSVNMAGPGTFDGHNILFSGGTNYTVLFSRIGTNTWTFKDNAFDVGSVTLAGTYDYNAYTSSNEALSGIQTHDIVTNFTYQTGPLGEYYQPTNSPLINIGSRTADLAGLYHYTTTVNEVKETNSVVDIGYHYVAVDGNGIPIDTDGDGIPDYLEDANGNGTVDSGETDWQSPTDLGLKVWITRPRNNSTIP